MKTSQQKRALVTGAASGIGLAIVREFHARGMQVVASDVSAEKLAQAFESLPDVRCVRADLSLKDAVTMLGREAGPIDVLVNNAGLQHVSPVETFEQSRWDLLLQVMLTAPFQLIQALLPGMYERSWGRIINVSSVHGLVASPFKSAYVSAKHGIMGLTKTVALEAGARTPLVEKQLADQAKAHGIPQTEVLEKVLLTQAGSSRAGSS